jgi:hypothetical protein
MIRLANRTYAITPNDKGFRFSVAVDQGSGGCLTPTICDRGVKNPHDRAKDEMGRRCHRFWVAAGTRLLQATGRRSIRVTISRRSLMAVAASFL